MLTYSPGLNANDSSGTDLPFLPNQCLIANDPPITDPSPYPPTGDLVLPPELLLPPELAAVCQQLSAGARAHLAPTPAHSHHGGSGKGHMAKTGGAARAGRVKATAHKFRQFPFTSKGLDFFSGAKI